MPKTKLVDKKSQYRRIADLNCNNEENVKKLNEIFSKIVFKCFGLNSDDLCNNDIIKLINNKFYKKFNCYMSYIFFSRSNKDGLSATLIDCNKSHDLICSVYGKTLEEVLKKSLACLYFYKKEEKEKLEE